MRSIVRAAARFSAVVLASARTPDVADEPRVLPWVRPWRQMSRYGLALTVVASLVVAVAPPPSAQSGDRLVPGTPAEAVSVQKATDGPTRKVVPAEPQWAPRRVVWPAASSATIDLPAAGGVAGLARAGTSPVWVAR